MGYALRVTFLWSNIESLARSPRLRVGAAWVGAAGACWALLCLRLWLAGQAPSRVLLPIPREDYYLWQSMFVVPLLLVSFAIAARVAHWAAAKLGGHGAYPNTANVFGFALAIPLLLVLLLPDFLVYETSGFAALGKLIRVTAPLSFLLTLYLASAGAQAAHGLSRGKSWIVAWAFVVIQALTGGALLR